MSLKLTSWSRATRTLHGPISLVLVGVLFCCLSLALLTFSEIECGDNAEAYVDSMGEPGCICVEGSEIKLDYSNRWGGGA